MAKLTVEDLDVKGQRVLVRVDFNVPLDEKLAITDDTRIRESLPTIRHIVESGGLAVLMAHLGRPHTERSEGEYLWACMSLDDGTYIEVPIHGVLADDIQAKLQAALDVHNDMMAAMGST